MLTVEKMGILVKEVAQFIMDREMRKRPGFRDISMMFWGPQGVGKTTGIKSASTSLHIPNINLRLAQYPPEDFGIPRVKEITHEAYVSYFIEYALPKFFPQEEVGENGKHVMRREIVNGEIVVTDQPRVDYKKLKKHITNYAEVSAYYESLGLDINDAPGATLLLDEYNRITDPNLFQMLFQLPENYGLRDYKVPTGISIFAAANPPTDEYQVGTWFDDAALANRFISVGIKYDYDSWRRYAVASGAYSARTLEFYSTFRKALHRDTPDFNINEVVCQSPRSSDYLNIFDSMIDIRDEDILFNVIQGILGTENAANYMKVRTSFVEKAVTGEEILFHYDAYDETMHAWDEQPAVSAVRQKIIQARESARGDYYNEATNNFVEYLETNILKDGFREKLEANMPHAVRFLNDLPADVMAATLKRLIEDEDDIHEAINDIFTYSIDLRKSLKAANKKSEASK